MNMWTKNCIFRLFFSDQPTKKSLEFTPGIIVKFAVNEPIEDEKKVKQRIRAAVMESVSYVDARIGQRFVSSIGNIGNGILFPKLFGPIVRKKNSNSDQKNLMKFKAEGQELAKSLRSLQQFIQTVKGPTNFWNRILF